jgi:HK97 gp10 family phage protein
MAELKWVQGFAGSSSDGTYQIGIAEIDAASDELLTQIAAEVAADARRFVAVDTGLLKSRIDSELVAPGRARVTAGTDYAVFLEQGTSRMRARPFLRPALFKRRGV